MSDKSPYEALMAEVCVGLGFCGSLIDGEPLYVGQFIPQHGTVSADQFVDWVLRAEGIDPSGADALTHRRSLRQAFVKHMGEVADAKSLK